MCQDNYKLKDWNHWRWKGKNLPGCKYASVDEAQLLMLRRVKFDFSYGKNSHMYDAITFSLAIDKCIFNQFFPFKQAGTLFKL